MRTILLIFAVLGSSAFAEGGSFSNVPTYSYYVEVDSSKADVKAEIQKCADDLHTNEQLVERLTYKIVSESACRSELLGSSKISVHGGFSFLK